MPVRVLVIEDNPASLELMSYLLRAYKYQPLSAGDGERGLALAIKERPDVVICDIHLPRMDGYEVVRRLKADAGTRAIPVIAVTAFAMVGDRDRALAAGFDGYIAKPIAPESFVAQVERFLSRTSGAQPDAVANAGAAAAPQQARRAGARILVVDNTLANRELLASVLEPVGYDVLLASNAIEALAFAKARVPDLIISDVHMPGADGYEFLRNARADPELQQVPFALISVSLMGHDNEHLGVEQGADAFLHPGEPQHILEEIDRLLAAAEKADGQDPGR